MAIVGTLVGTGFGLRQIAIAPIPTAPSTIPVWTPIPSVEEAAGKFSVGEVQQWGDDRLQGTFYHSQQATVTVKFNKLAFGIFEQIAGVATQIISATTQSLLFGTDLELNPPLLMLRGQVAFRHDDGTLGNLYMYWFRCNCKSPYETFPAAVRAKIAENTLVFNAFTSTVDEQGNPITGGPGYAFGRFAAN